MPGLNIPGVTDKYNTNDTVEKLIKIERVPLTRKQDTLKTYQAQRNAWRDVNRKLTEFRDSVKTLYSYENPFNNKLASSSDEYAITADANWCAQYQSFKVNVIQPATADRFPWHGLKITSPTLNIRYSLSAMTVTSLDRKSVV